jgi:hypothetical protein
LSTLEMFSEISLPVPSQQMTMFLLVVLNDSPPSRLSKAPARSAALFVAESQNDRAGKKCNPRFRTLAPRNREVCLGVRCMGAFSETTYVRQT